MIAQNNEKTKNILIIISHVWMALLLKHNQIKIWQDINNIFNHHQIFQFVHALITFFAELLRNPC